MAEDVCPLIQNSDFYGLGIRLGVYTQLISTLLSNHLLPKELGAAWDANFVFLAALLTATVKSAAGSQPLLPVEVFVLLQMMLAYPLAVFSATGSVSIAIVENLADGADGYWSQERRDAVSAVTALVRAHKDHSPSGKFLRKTLVIAIAVFSVWFWFSGFHRSFDSRESCKEHVFLFASVRVDGPAAMAFQAFSAWYLIYKSLPVLLKFGNRILRIILRNVIDRRKAYKSKGQEVESQDADSEESIEGNTSKDFRTKVLCTVAPPSVVIERCGIAPNEYKLKKWKAIPKDRIYRSRLSKLIHFYGHVVLFNISLLVIIYSILSIEFTLAWNNFDGIYEASSPGQFIPLFIGLTTLTRTLILIFIEYMAVFVKRVRREITRNNDTAVWRYRLSSHAETVFSATPITRRWSFDESRELPDLKPKHSTKRPLYKMDRLAPVLPIVPQTIDTRFEEQSSNKHAVVRRDTGRFLYQSRMGKQYVFHRHCPERRNSISEGIQFHLETPRPHQLRSHMDVPLKERRKVERKESKRAQWYEIERGRQYHQRRVRENEEETSGSYRSRSTTSRNHSTHRRTSRYSSNASTDSPRSQSTHQSWRFVPPVVTTESIFSSTGYGSSHDTASGSHSIQRRWSFDDLTEARDFADDFSSIRRFSRMSSPSKSSSNESSSHHESSSSRSENDAGEAPSPKAAKFVIWLKRLARLQWILWISIIITNSVCCCAPCMAVGIHCRRVWRAWRLKPDGINQGDNDSNHQSYSFYSCPQCDQNYAEQKDIRQSRRGSSNNPPVSSSFKAPFGLSSLLRWSIGPRYTMAVMRQIFVQPQRVFWHWIVRRTLFNNLQQEVNLTYGKDIEAARNRS